MDLQVDTNILEEYGDASIFMAEDGSRVYLSRH
jgi:hypothetical protein